MDADEEEGEAPTLVSIDADEKDEEVAFFPVDKMLHEQVHDFLEVCEEYFGNRLSFNRNTSSLVRRSLGLWG